MSLATRCTSCGTVFRVVQDQLKVSEGWVRCGRCDSVFNALEGLFDLDRDPPPEWTEPAAPAQQAVDFRVDGDDEPGPLPRDPSLVDRIDEQIFGTRRSAFGSLGGIGRNERAEPEFADARFDSDSPDDIGAGPLPIGPTDPESDAAGDDSRSPAFVLEAERVHRWQSSRARKVLAAGALLLTVLLAGQVVHHHRNEIAARWPTTHAALAHWCSMIGCVLEAPHRIDDIVVESTSLARGSVGESFRLSVVLRNRAATPAAVPWVELSLTDANGELVARRALSPPDLRAARAEIGSGAEMGLTASLSTGTSRVTGYTVEVFYP